MFYRTSEFDAGFGVQPDEITELKRADGPGRPASPWRRTIEAFGQWSAHAIRRRQTHRPARLTLDGLSDHMLSDLGLTRTDLGALGGAEAFRSRSRSGRRG